MGSTEHSECFSESLVVLLSSPPTNGIYKSPEYYGDGIRVVHMTELFQNKIIDNQDIPRVRLSKAEADNFSALPGDVLIARRSIKLEGVAKPTLIGNTATPLSFESSIIRLRPNPDLLDSLFLLEFLESEEGRRQIRTIARQVAVSGVAGSDLKYLRVPLLPLPEQRKIAEILRTWDEAIDACERRATALRQQFDGLRLKIFEAAYASDNRVRQAKDLFDPVSEKNQPDLPLLAVMQDIGVVRRDELDRRVVMPDGDVDGYKVVRKGDFVISLRSFEGGLEFSRVTGLVSPAYTVLRPNGGEYVGDYYRHYFKSRSFIGRLDRLIFGIRDGKQISFRDFGDMRIPNPIEDEQAKAAAVLGLAERQIQLAEQEAGRLQMQKRGLMQKLLTGEWRVTIREAGDHAS